MILYEIAQDFAELAEAWQNDIENESNIAYEEKFDALTCAFEDKATNIAMFVRNVDADNDAIDLEISRLQKLKKGNENKVKWLKEYLKNCMLRAGKTKIDTPLFKISISKNPPSVGEIIEDKVPAKYWRIIPETREIDKKAIIEDFKAGIGVVGVEVIADKTRLNIR